MRTTLSSIALLTLLTACGGGGNSNPVTGGRANTGTEPDTGEATGPEGAVTVGTTKSRQYGDITGVTLNDDGSLTIDNLPFDGPAGGAGNPERYAQMAIIPVTGFDAYESGNPTNETNQDKYFAVYAKGAHSSATAVATGDYRDFGWKGAQYTRDNVSAPDIRRDGEAVYNGNYAGVRIAQRTGGGNDVAFTSGTVRLEVDFLDFEGTGSIKGRVSERQVFNTNGTPIGTLPVIVLAASSADDQGFISNSRAGSQNRNEPLEDFETGSWEGAFAGPNSEEISGIIILNGPAAEPLPNAPIVPNIPMAQEVGAFIASDPE